MRRWWLRAIVSVAVIAVLFSIAPIEQVWTAVREVNPLVWLASVAVFVAGHAMNALKLRVLLGPEAASIGTCLRAHFAGIAGNLGLPGVAGGDIVRASYLAATAGTARVAVAAVADRVVDLSVLLAMALLSARIAGVPAAAAGPGESRPWLIVAIAAVSIAVVVAVARRVKRSATKSAYRDALSMVLARRWAFAVAAVMSATVQSTFVLTNVWLGSEVGVSVALAPWFLAWTATKVSVILPVSLGGLGVREATLVAVLAAYGAPADRALAAGFLWQGALITGSTGGFLLTQLMHRDVPPTTVANGLPPATRRPGPDQPDS